MASQGFLLGKDKPRERILAHVATVLGALPQGKAWKLTVEEYKPRRSLSQNALLWAIYQQVIDRGGEAMRGWTKEDLHSFFSGNFHGWEKVQIFGQARMRPLGRSSTMDKQVFSDYIESIVLFMAEQGIVIDTNFEKENAT